MTTYVEMFLLWLLRLAVLAVVLFAFFQMSFEFAPFNALADVVYDFGLEVPQIVLRHTTGDWRLEHNCLVGYVCKGVAIW